LVPATAQEIFEELVMKGQVAHKFPAAAALEAGKTYYWCSCEKSSKQPFCDGSQKGSEFTPLAYSAEGTKTVYFCQCKQTGTPPFCDGSHKAAEVVHTSASPQ
jgi:CDGSH-type Zn-finger protein